MERAYVCNVVIDLEFTSVPKRMRQKGLGREIIEVGAVKLAADGTVCGEFSHMVKPELAGGVSGAVHQMTGIGNEDLTCARPLGEVLEALTAWIGPGRVRMVTWSDSDLHQITDECAAKGIEHHLPGRWLDIQRLYPRLMDLERTRRVSLGEAADWCGIDNDRASAHRALYDAQVTAEIFRMMAAGECAEHRSRMQAELQHEKESFTASIGSQCGDLAGLMAQLRALEGKAA